MNRWSLLFLTMLSSLIIVALILVSQQDSWTISVPILSIVLGWLLKTISDSVTLSQQHNWELERIADERTLNYYETKLNEMSLYVVDELSILASSDWEQENKTKFTKEWVTWSSSARTFVQVVGDDEIVAAYTETANQSSQWLKFVGEYKSGQYHAYDRERLQIKIQDEMKLYMDKLKNFQVVIERIRLKVLRGEIVIRKARNEKFRLSKRN